MNKNRDNRFANTLTGAISRRTALRGGAALASLSVLRLTGPVHAFQDDSGGEVIPWLDQPEPNPVPEVIVRQLEWEKLDAWLTPPDQFFVIKHFAQPELSEQDWSLEIGGLIAQPMTLTSAHRLQRLQVDAQTRRSPPGR